MVSTFAPEQTGRHSVCFLGSMTCEFLSDRKAYAAHTMQAAVTAIASPNPNLVAGGAGKSKQTSKQSKMGWTRLIQRCGICQPSSAAAQRTNT
ncbi:hypothetical protein Rcae01_00785 [Novipirellula caenicola]|uniref:Uncharacterized protein n=1 Tax=Novipirellula caenicola TaxID=1536901 RepID=A0ABP9VKY6_9BACT